MIYLASPYTHPEAMVRYDRFLRVNSVAAELMREGLHVFSPISHCHSIATMNQLPTDWEFWQDHCKAGLKKCDSLWVLKLDGWKESRGVAMEIATANLMLMPIEYREIQSDPYRHPVQ